MPNYWYWTAHGKSKPIGVDINVGDSNTPKFMNTHHYLYQNMVFDATGPSNFGFDHYHTDQNNKDIDEPPIGEASRFYDMLNLLNSSCTSVVKHFLNYPWLFN
ncbi:hypothetical protein ACH5RR_029987 [Cinchona calisaya]|uniref:Uncharacterized protein n=1 Tax=Cinchona calisaya TaxID=153742 RepID=A0ABD2YUP9_9GENT